VLLILRDEDVEAVGSAITAIALQHGLEPLDPETLPVDIFSLAATMLAPRVVLASGEDFVLADGLASLGIGDAKMWGEALSSACGNEVVAIAPTGDGIRVMAFDDGEEDHAIDVHLDPSGTTRSEALAEIAPSDEAADELRKGVPALNAIELAAQVLRLFDAGEDRHVGEPATLSFHDPRADEAGEEGEEGEADGSDE
jgi:hypothetical protein